MAEKITAVVAKEADGTIQITFTLPWDTIKKSREEALAEIAKDAEVPGFRKGKAPVSEVSARTSKETVIRKTLGTLLPKAIGDALVEHKLRPAIYPRVEVVSADEEKPWQVTALTCELPAVELGNYRQTLKGAAKSKAIWTPDKGKEAPKEPTREEKQQEVIKILLDSIKVNIPKILINEEVDTRLSSLLDRIEKLGLTLESYLASIGKTPESIREEYARQAQETITLDLILDKVADEEKLKVEESQIDEVIKASAADPHLQKKLDTPEQRRLIASVLRRRASLDSLTGLL